MTVSGAAGMATAKAVLRERDARDPPVGDHDGVPINPFRRVDPYGGRERPESLTARLVVAAPRLTDPNFVRRVILVLDHGSQGALGVVINRPGGVHVDEILPQWQTVAASPAEVFTGGPVARNAIIGLVRLRPGSDAADLEPVDPEAADLEAADPEAADLEAADPEPTDPEPADPEPADPEPADPGVSPPAMGGSSGEERAGFPTGWRPLFGTDSLVGTVDVGADPRPVSASMLGARLFSGYAGWDAGQLESEIDEGSWFVVPADERDPLTTDPEGLWQRVLHRQGGVLSVLSRIPADPSCN